VYRYARFRLVPRARPRCLAAELAPGGEKQDVALEGTQVERTRHGVDRCRVALERSGVRRRDGVGRPLGVYQPLERRAHARDLRGEPLLVRALPVGVGAQIVTFVVEVAQSRFT